MNVQSVLVPVDFSPPSRLAVGYGVSLARKFRARLILMHVVESPSTLVHSFKEESGKVENEQREQALRMLSALVAPEDQDDLDLKIVLKTGEIKDEILSVIAEQQAGIAVMGTHGRGLFGRWIIGSITESILRKVSIPVLTVSRATLPLAFKRILLATDLSEPSTHGFRFALEMVRMMNSELLLLHVAEKVSLSYGGSEAVRYVSQHNIEEAKAKLAELAAEAHGQKVRTETIVVEGVAAEEILKSAEDNTADLILVTIRGKGLIERALVGTTAERVIREANVPVLSIPAGIEAHPERMAELHTANP